MTRPVQQKPRELALLADLVYHHGPVDVVVEIGVAGGGTLAEWCRITSLTGQVIGIDTPEGIYGGEAALTAFELGMIRQGTQTVEVVEGDSHDPRVFNRLGELLDGEPVDFLFIDGDHTYTGVKRDWEMYAPLVREGGCVAFHDIVPHPPEAMVEVERFWQEVRDEYLSVEIIDHVDRTIRDGQWAGIGVLLI